jgi:hypothetical protein
MDERRITLFVGLLSFLAVLFWAFFLNASTLVWNDFFLYALEPLFKKMFTYPFLFFLVFFPLPYGILLGFSER